LEEVTARVGPKVLTEVDGNISKIVGDPQWILDYQLRPRPTSLSNMFIVFINYIKLNNKKLMTTSS
jgi:hypothetical protein